ncbi:hypothetical protein K523DRAFT_362452 [Schizophyllum commune Tattone D]|nr:hypothetical protein K523DRAFT_362452 [Schizophyllum commune Tattone D]
MPPSSAPPPNNNPPRPPSIDADAAANSGQKRPASPSEGPVRKAPVMDRQEKAVNALPTDSLTRLTLQETLEVFTLLEEDANAAATVEGWAVISSRLIQAVAKAIPGLHNGDEVEDSRAASRVQNALRDALRQFSYDTEDDDAAMEDPADQTPTPPQPTSPPTSIQEVLLQVQKSFQSLNSRLSRLETRVAHSTAHTSSKSTPPKPSTPSPNAEPPTSTQAAPTAAPSFAKAAAKEPVPPAKASSARSTPASEPKPPRYIIRFQGKPPTNRETPLIISRRINQRLALTPSANGLRVIGSSWNASNNIVLTFPPKTAISHIEAHIPCIRKALTIDEAVPISHDIFTS